PPDPQIVAHHDDRHVDAREEVVEVVRRVAQLDVPDLELLVDRRELLVDRLQLLLRGLQLLVGTLQLLVAREGFLVRGLELLVGRLELLDDGLEVSLAVGELAPETRELAILQALPSGARLRLAAGPRCRGLSGRYLEQDQEISSGRRR